MYRKQKSITLKQSHQIKYFFINKKTCVIKVDAVQSPNNQNEQNANKPLIKECRQNNRPRCEHNDEHVMPYGNVLISYNKR